MTPMVHRPSVIPPATYAIAAIVFALFFVLMIGVAMHDSDLPFPAQIVLPIMAGAFLSGYVLLIGYIYGDARRRCMRYVAWTFLAALAPSAIGIILYFILRNPMPVHCTRCGCGVTPGFAYCPRCGAPMSATCRQCNRAAETGWSHCAWCGSKL